MWARISDFSYLALEIDQNAMLDQKRLDEATALQGSDAQQKRAVQSATAHASCSPSFHRVPAAMNSAVSCKPESKLRQCARLDLYEEQIQISRAPSWSHHGLGLLRLQLGVCCQIPPGIRISVTIWLPMT